MTAPFTWSEGRINTAYDRCECAECVRPVRQESADDRLAAPFGSRVDPHMCCDCLVRSLMSRKHLTLLTSTEELGRWL